MQSEETKLKVIVVALERISQAFRSMLWEHAKSENLSPIQIQFLVFMATHPRENSFVSELAKEFNLTAATVSEAVKTLENKGLVKKKINPDDHRQSFVFLTKKGLTTTKNLVGWQDKIFQHVREYPLETTDIVVRFLLGLIESLNKDNLLPAVRTCLSCKYFTDGDDSTQNSEPWCLLRDASLEEIGFKIDCPNYLSGDHLN